MDYQSHTTRQAKSVEGVSFTIARMSFGRRIGLLQRIRELSGKAGFLAAGKTPADQVEAVLLTRQVERLYLEWGLKGVRGFSIDGAEVTPENLFDDGPEELCREIVEAVKAECGLSENDRKN